VRLANQGKSVGQVLELPPADRDWTTRERLLLHDMVIALKRDGIAASRYEWLTSREVWCSFCEGRRHVVADVGRVDRIYYVHWPRSGTVIRAYDLGYALEMVRTKWRLLG
jgi:hypothetical protein